MKKTKCQICHHFFYIGFNGTVDGCDKCTNTVRDANGHAWLPNEKYHLYLVGKKPLKTLRVTRHKALNPK